MPTQTVIARATLQAGAPSTLGPEPLTFGVPLPVGRVLDVTRLAACAGHALPTAARALEHWPDGSVRWALLDVLADVPSSGLALEIRDDVAPPDGPAPIDLTVTGRSAIIRGGTVEAAFDLDDPRLLTACSVGGRAVLGCRSPVVHLVDEAERPLAVTFTSIEVEHHTALRAVVQADGHATTSKGGRIDVRLRCSFVAGWPVLGVELGLLNPQRAEHRGGFWELGDRGSVHLRGAAVVCAAPSVVTGGEVSFERGQAPRPFAAPLAVVQHASGGEQWNSRVHVNSAGVVALAARGYETRVDGVAASGLRANPTITCRHADGGVAVTSRLFWEVFPKAIEIDGDGSIHIWSLPVASGLHEIQGGERCDFEAWLSFGAPAAIPAWCQLPSTVLPVADGVSMAEHLPALQAIDPGAGGTYDTLVSAAVDGDDTLLVKRERIDEYGWRHFGDLYADHENGPDPERRLVSHYNNQYDAVLGLTLQAVRRGDHRWWRQAMDLARHVTRTDIYWTTEDRAAFNGGLFWHTAHYTDAGTSTHRTYPRDAGLPGGGPSVEHCYSHGLLLHHMLTGDPLSRLAVIRLGEWVLGMDDGRRSRWPLPWLSAAPTGGASATVSEDYHGPGRGAANAILALLNASRLTTDRRFADKAEELVRRVISPRDDVPARRLLDVEPRWSYTVLLQTLGRYLWLHEARGRDERWEYARASLLHYASWMADHERCYLDAPAALEFPTETWAAQDIRKSEVFDLAALHATSAEARSRYLERAAYFHRRALDTLAASPTRTRTRPLVLLMLYGFARSWFETHTSASPLHPPLRHEWPPPRAFEPQKAIVRRRMARLAAVGAGGLLLLLLIRLLS